MQFKYPAVFYFLFVLIIPIVVHLFQLQKFKKIAFTNVQFLQKISLETRKSSRLKKLLLLATRMLCFLALLFTFSKPYFGDKKAEAENHNYIYLDNSMSYEYEWGKMVDLAYNSGTKNYRKRTRNRYVFSSYK